MPSIIDNAGGNNAGAATVTLSNPAGASSGDRMLALLSADSNNVSISNLQGWTLLSDTTFNTRRAYLLERDYASSYAALTLSGARGVWWTVLAVRGAAGAPTLGSVWRRVDNGGSITTTECPSIASQPIGALAIGLTTETSTGAETEAQVTFSGTGWAKYLWTWTGDADVSPNHWIGQRTLTTDDATNTVTTTWPNASSNSIGVQVVYAATVTTGTVATNTPTVAATIPSSSWSGTVAAPTVTGTLAANAPSVAITAPTAAWSGAATIPAFSGTSIADTPSVAVHVPLSAWSGTATVPTFAGSLTASTPAVTGPAPSSSWAGMVVAPSGGGGLASTTPAVTVGVPVSIWAGTATVPDYSGLIDADTPHVLVSVPVATWAGSVTAAVPISTAGASLGRPSGRPHITPARGSRNVTTARGSRNIATV